MKYIRTKDKILLMNEGYYDKFGRYHSITYIKEADNIEELCDAYVCIVSNYDPVYCSF